MKSLRVRLTIAIVLITLAASTIVGIGLRSYTQREFSEFLEVEAEFEAVEFPDLREVERQLGAGATDQAAKRLQDLAGDERMILLGPNGELLADTAPRGERIRFQDGELELVASVPAGAGEKQRNETIRLRGGLPLRDGSRQVGTLFALPGRTDVGPAEPASGFRRKISGAHAVGVAVATLLALIIALLLSRRIVGPVESLTGAAARLARGDLSQRVQVESADEIGTLGRTFNQMAESLERQEQARRAMTGDVAHELRTPLTHLRCKLESVQDGLVQPDRALVDELHGEIVHLGRLVDDLQELAQAEAGRLPLYPARVGVAAVLGEVVRALPSDDVRIATADALPAVHVDPDRLRQVLRNLLENAMRHGGGGPILLEAARDGDTIAIQVVDEGPGIPDDQLDRVFDRFYRTDPSRARDTGGAGLGLAIARQLVEAWGGELDAERGRDRGAAFRFTVPISV